MEVSLPDLLGSGRRRVLNFANGKTDLAEVYRQTMTKPANALPPKEGSREGAFFLFIWRAARLSALIPFYQ